MEAKDTLSINVAVIEKKVRRIEGIVIMTAEDLLNIRRSAIRKEGKRIYERHK